MNNNKSILFIHFTSFDLALYSGGGRRTWQNYQGCSAHLSCEAVKTGFSYKNIIILIQSYLKLNQCVGISSKQCNEILKKIKDNKYKIVFLDASGFYGTLAKIIKKNFPDVKIIVHYHNFEKKFSSDDKSNNGIKDFFIQQCTEKNEKLSSLYSDFRVFISEEDRENVCKEYKISKENSIVIPPTLEDGYLKQNYSFKEPYILFLGFSFFANNEACKFLIEKVAPKIKVKIIIAGTGMKKEFQGSYKNVEVLDFTPNLNKLMSGAAAFVSPIFSGSGAKIKIAEALMHGKYIIGTKQSFNGYDIENADVSICNSAEEFIKAINNLDLNKRFYERNRELFLTKYSMDKNAQYYEFLKEL